MESRAVISLPYFGNLSFYSQLHKGDLCIEAHENYQKKSWRNKTTILSANGPLILTVPLKKGKHSQKQYTDVEIAYYDNWIKSHIQSITAAYANSAYFEHYFDPISATIANNYDSLWDLNLKLVTIIKGNLGIVKELNFSTEYEASDSYDLDFRRKAPESKNKAYPQVFESKFGFVKNMSILDLLFNLGPESYNYL